MSKDESSKSNYSAIFTKLQTKAYTKTSALSADETHFLHLFRQLLGGYFNGDYSRMTFFALQDQYVKITDEKELKQLKQR